MACNSCKEKNKEKSISIWGDGNSKREFMYIEDLARFIIKNQEINIITVLKKI